MCFTVASNLLIRKLEIHNDQRKGIIEHKMEVSKERVQISFGADLPLALLFQQRFTSS